jgi:hypothetical protein
VNLYVFVKENKESLKQNEKRCTTLSRFETFLKELSQFEPNKKCNYSAQNKVATK